MRLQTDCRRDRPRSDRLASRPRLPPNVIDRGRRRARGRSGLRAGVDWPDSTPVRIAGNLPYNISSPDTCSNCSTCSGKRIVGDATLMLQREVADRILATPGQAITAYSACSFSGELTSPACWPSRPVRFDRRQRSNPRSSASRSGLPSFPVADERVLERMVRGMFTQRRKTLSNALAPFGTRIGVAAADALREAHIDPRRRPETLEIVEIARLADVFAAANR